MKCFGNSKENKIKYRTPNKMCLVCKDFVLCSNLILEGKQQQHHRKQRKDFYGTKIQGGLENGKNIDYNT